MNEMRRLMETLDQIEEVTEDDTYWVHGHNNQQMGTHRVSEAVPKETLIRWFRGERPEGIHSSLWFVLVNIRDKDTALRAIRRNEMYGEFDWRNRDGRCGIGSTKKAAHRAYIDSKKMLPLRSRGVKL